MCDGGRNFLLESADKINVTVPEALSTPTGTIPMPPYWVAAKQVQITLNALPIGDPKEFSVSLKKASSSMRTFSERPRLPLLD